MLRAASFFPHLLANKNAIIIVNISEKANAKKTTSSNLEKSVKSFPSVKKTATRENQHYSCRKIMVSIRFSQVGENWKKNQTNLHIFEIVS